MKTKIIHYQSATEVYKTYCGLWTHRGKNTTRYLNEVTCGNCRRNKVFMARVRLEITAKKIRAREQLKAP